MTARLRRVCSDGRYLVNDKIGIEDIEGGGGHRHARLPPRQPAARHHRRGRRGDRGIGDDDLEPA
ncbi:hypothetical protein ACFQ07_20525, partial [Actinomadura adrarensis]